MYNCISNTIATIIRCERWRTLFILICILFIYSPAPSQFTLFPFCSLFSFFIIFDQDNLETAFFRLTSNDDNSSGAHFQLEYILYIRSDPGLLVSPCRSILNVFRLFKLHISKYRYTFRFCRIVLPLYPYLLNVIFVNLFYGGSSGWKTTDFSSSSFLFFQIKSQ